LLQACRGRRGGPRSGRPGPLAGSGSARHPRPGRAAGPPPRLRRGSPRGAASALVARRAEDGHHDQPAEPA